jgi:tetratricopeptide (TPR) repeat protein/CHAT domain-containing protein
MVSAQGIEEHLNKANALHQAQKTEEAIDEFEKVVALLKKEGNLPGAQQIQVNIGIIHLQQNNLDLALTELETARALYDQPDPDIDLKLTRTMATVQYRLGHYALQADLLEGLLKRVQALDEATQADIWAELGDSYRRNEIYRTAIQYYAQALAYASKLKDRNKQALILTALGQCQAKLGDFKNAGDNLNQALVLARELEAPQNLAEINSNLGIISWDQGDYARAIEFVREAQRVETSGNLKQNLGADYNNEGLILKSVGNYPGALAAIETALGLAREIKDTRSEAIALSNRALVLRITGRFSAAMDDYQAALKLYDLLTFKEGQASCYLGLGKLYEIDRRDYQKAYEYYQLALALYQELGNLPYQAEALNQIGRVLKKGIDPNRTTRDLLYVDDEPIFVKISPQEALSQSRDAYQRALKLAEEVNRREAVWSAQQGLGYMLAHEGKLEQADHYYKAAVENVMSLRSLSSDPELMSDYLKDKDDLFTEAMELMDRLYTENRKQEYLQRMMEYQEIYRNEVLKEALSTANIDFQDTGKADLLSRIKETTGQKNQLERLAERHLGLASKKLTGAGQAERDNFSKMENQLAQERQYVQGEAAKLDKSINELLGEWAKRYPSEADLFDSSVVVDIESLQKNIGVNQAIIQFFPLPDKLSILCITREGVTKAETLITYRELAGIIRDDFVYRQIEVFGRGGQLGEKRFFDRCNQVLAKLHDILLGPVREVIKDKAKLVIIPCKYLSYVPFSALVQGFDEDGQPRYLVYDKAVSYLRLSFLAKVNGLSEQSPILGDARILAVGNPLHTVLQMPDLPGAVQEVEQLKTIAAADRLPEPELMIRDEATEDLWKEKVTNNHYNIFYFATHGVPFAEMLYIRKQAENSLSQWKSLILEETEEGGRKTVSRDIEEKVEKWQPYLEFCDRVFTSKSPLYGFLYLSYSGNEQNDGVLTLKEITELPDSVFSEARMAILSACNTAVTYSPKISPELRKEMEEETKISQELIRAGWNPGVDQICLTDTFMKRNLKYVLGTLWFAEDQATKFLTNKFVENLATLDPPEAMRQAQLAYLENPPLGPEVTQYPGHPFFWAVTAIFGP